MHLGAFLFLSLVFVTDLATFAGALAGTFFPFEGPAAGSAQSTVSALRELDDRSAKDEGPASGVFFARSANFTTFVRLLVVAWADIWRSTPFKGESGLALRGFGLAFDGKGVGSSMGEELRAAAPNLLLTPPP